MVTLNKPSAGDTDWTTEINDNWTTLESLANGRVVVVKSANESVTSNSPHDDSELEFSIGANETWQFEIRGFYTSSSATPDIKVALNGPAKLNLRYHCIIWGAAADAMAQFGLKTDYEDFTTINHGTAPDTLFTIHGSVVNDSTPGTVVLRWAQNTTSATPTTLRKGSYLLANRV